MDLIYVLAGVTAIVLMFGAVMRDAYELASFELRPRRWESTRPRFLGTGWYAVVLAAILALFLAAAMAR